MLFVSLWWKFKAWPWLRKHWWQVLIFPVGLTALYLAFRRRQEVVAPELVGAAEVQRQAEDEAEEARGAAETKRSSDIERIEEEHQETIDGLNEEQKARLEVLREDPDELNDFLLRVGRDVRGGGS